MIKIKTTDIFDHWLTSLKNEKAKSIITERLVRLSNGLLGDVKYFKGIGELRITHGKGYRVYFIKRGNEIIILLNGGDKSTQQKDIEKALKIVKELKNGIK
ncbi:type II toxin-antitoxin system RelE/ParE family toxin [Bartonella sp. DGB1]|uniref:type II toxin-antitoxin system RelE/ParE family toxin n=1 Tax=Bartonella sp. DGB1 TaxID=3239807 RepID=UPI003525DB29